MNLLNFLPNEVFRYLEELFEDNYITSAIVIFTSPVNKTDDRSDEDSADEDSAQVRNLQSWQM